MFFLQYGILFCFTWSMPAVYVLHGHLPQVTCEGADVNTVTAYPTAALVILVAPEPGLHTHRMQSDQSWLHADHAA